MTDKTYPKVFITGIGTVTAVGRDYESTMDAVFAGRGGIQRMSFEADGGFKALVGHVPVALPARERLGWFARCASDEAIVAADLAHGSVDRVILGSALGQVVDDGWPIGMGAVDRIGMETARRYGRRDRSPAVRAINSSFVSGADAIGHGWQAIRFGEADCVLAGGVEAPITPAVLAGFTAMGAAAPVQGDPAAGIRPFDLHRDGCALGEGAAFLVLESARSATERDAEPLAELIGYGTASDAFHVTQLPDDGDGLLRAMADAMSVGGVQPGEVGYLNAHGTGTPMNDRIESLVIDRIFGPAEAQPWVSSTKPMTGHLLGASGAIEAAIAIAALRRMVAPVSLNLTTPDPECGVRIVAGASQPFERSITMSTSMGFGGNASALLFKRHIP